MGNREALLDAAKRCLAEKGYANTTARDIASAAGTSLAAIGYHYRSTEALLNAALVEAMGDWGDELARTLATDDQNDPSSNPGQRFERTWERVLESLASQRTVWAASFEIFTVSERMPEVREQLADATEEARLGLAQLLGGVDPADDLQLARAVGSFYQALLSGFVGQWLIDPDRAPSAAELTAALQFVSAIARRPT